MKIPNGQAGRYSNYFKVGYNAAEMVIEFGQMYDEGEDEKIHTRVVTTVPYAHALCELLERTLREHEVKYGPSRPRETTEET